MLEENNNIEFDEKSKEINKQSIGKNIFEWVYTILIALIISFFVIGNIGSFTVVSGISMEPSFYNKDKVVLNRITYRFNDIEIDDVVVLNTEKDKNGIIYNMFDEFSAMIDNVKFKLNLREELNKDNLIKRVVAKPGDTVEIIDGKLFVNGKVETRETFKGETYEIYDLVEYPLVLKEDEYFVLGDNRENSLDSRAIGPIKKIQIKGKVPYRIYPKETRGKI